MLARPRPLRHDGGEQVERAQTLAREERLRWKRIGEHFPQVCSRCVEPALMRWRVSSSASLHQRSG